MEREKNIVGILWFSHHWKIIHYVKIKIYLDLPGFQIISDMHPSFFTVYLTCGGNGAFAWTDLNLDYGLFKSAKTFDVFSYLCVYQLLNYCALFCTNICMPWLEATRPWLVCHPIAAASMYSKLFQNITFVCNCNNHCKTKFYFT